MKKSFILNLLKIFILIFLIGFINNAFGFSTHSKAETISVFFKADSDIINFFKFNFNLINYSIDPENADINILFLSHSAANGGETYLVIFTGRKSFEGINDSLKISFQKTDSKETKYEGLLKILKVGLVRYFSYTDLLNDIEIIYPSGAAKNEAEVDNWDFWFFNVSASGSMEAEESKKSFQAEGEINAKRETYESKTNLSFSYNNELQKFSVEEAETKSIKTKNEFKGLYVKSLGSHLSAGIYSGFSSNSFKNLGLKASAGPAVEYNYFPYSYSLSKELSLKYQLEYEYQSYLEKTILKKTKENLIGQSLRIKYELKDIWGSVSISLNGSNYLNDFSISRLEFESDIAIRIFEGFSVDANIQANLIHDQIYLPLKNASEEEILLNQIKLASQYEFSINFGVSYSFGSIYNNIINTRF